MTDHSEHWERSVRRLLQRVRSDVAALPDDAERRVHDIRVGMKTLRAWMDLADAALTRARMRAMRCAVRSLKSAFGEARDAAVMAELARGLGGQWTEPCALPADGGDEGRALALAACDELLGWDPWLDGPLLLPALEKAACRTYRAARRQMRACAGDADDEAFHSWRKSVKSLGYQLDWLLPAGAHADWRDAMRRLGSLLGKHHDHAVLEARLLVSPVPGLHPRRVREEKARLAHEVCRLGGEVFASQASGFRKMLAGS